MIKIIVFLVTGTAGSVKCRVWGEPHIQTWMKGTGPTPSPCTKSGLYPLMMNQWVSFLIRVSGGYLVEVNML